MPLVLGMYFLLSILPSMTTLNGTTPLLQIDSRFALAYKSIVFVAFIGYLVFYVIKNSIKVNWILFLILLCLLFSESSAIWFSPESSKLVGVDGTTIVNFATSLSERIASEVSLLRYVLTAYILIAIIPSGLSKKGLSFLGYTMVFFSLFSMLYLFAFQSKTLINNWRNSVSYSSEISSFFTNKNTFGFLLFVGSASSFYLQKTSNETKKILLICFNVLSLLLSFVCYCRTTVMVSLIFYITLTIFWLVHNRANKKYVFIAIILCIICALGGTILALSLFSSLSETNSFFKFIANYAKKILSTLQDSSAYSRTTIWKWTFNYLLTPQRFFFGYGDNICNEALYSVSSVLPETSHAHSSFHNGLLESFVAGGFIRVFIYIYVLIGYPVRAAFQKHPRNSADHSLFIALFIAFIFYQSLENIVLFSTTSFSFPLSIMLISIPMSSVECKQTL